MVKEDCSLRRWLLRWFLRFKNEPVNTWGLSIPGLRGTRHTQRPQSRKVYWRSKRKWMDGNMVSQEEKPSSGDGERQGPEPLRPSGPFVSFGISFWASVEWGAAWSSLHLAAVGSRGLGRDWHGWPFGRFLSGSCPMWASDLSLSKAQFPHL